MKPITKTPENWATDWIIQAINDVKSHINKHCFNQKLIQELLEQIDFIKQNIEMILTNNCSCTNSELLDHNKKQEQGLENKVKKLQAENKKLRKLIYTDSLTWIYNRYWFDTWLERKINRVQTNVEKKDISLGIIDIDSFKSINDTYWHSYGDEVLIFVSNFIQQYLDNKNEILFRYGWEEFAIISTSIKEELQKKLEKILAKLQQQKFPLSDGKHSLTITFSWWVSQTNRKQSKVDGQSLIIKADKMLYFAKQSWKNQIAWWSKKETVTI